jgi:pimeloyl-ACP methyl ester carboxylesterase
MTTPDAADGDTFEPLSDGVSARADVLTEGTNVCRAAALAPLFRGATAATNALTTELRAIGFSEPILQSGARHWSEQDLFERLGGFGRIFDTDLDQARMGRWAEMNENDDPRAAVEFLLAMLGSSLERESAAAAAALWRGLDLGAQLPQRSVTARRRIYDYLLFDPRYGDAFDSWLLQPFGLGEFGFSAFDVGDTQPWNSDSWLNTYQQLQFRLGRDRYIDAFVVATTVRARLAQALRSPDPVTLSVAIAALVPGDAAGGPPPAQKSTLPSTASPPEPVVSTIVHGTGAWVGDWWRPKVGDFHQFIHDNYRPNLYDGGARFSWSGAYKTHHRAKAAEDFADWASELAPHGIQTLFGHSYGGEIASRAANLGVPIQQLVLLSAPVTSHVMAAAASGREIVDIRLPLDPVLALELRPQRISARKNVTEVITSWRLSHSATHRKSVWVSENIAERAQIQPEPNLVSG